MMGGLRQAISGFAQALSQGFKSSRLRAKVDLVEFLHTRAAYVAQTALYGYLKTRMGTQFASIFQDDRFAGGLAEARTRVFLDCLSDLTMYAIARIADPQRCTSEVCAAAAAACFEVAADAARTDPAHDALIREACEAFTQRAVGADWVRAIDPQYAFTQSPPGLVTAAPVISDYKELDREIVENSVRLRWVDVRRQFRKRADFDALFRDLIEEGINAPE